MARNVAELFRLFLPQRDYAYFVEHDRRPFAPDADRFDARNAWWLAEISMLAYVDDPEFVEAQLKRAGAREVACVGFSSKAATAALIAAFDGWNAVVFRGTEVYDPRDWALDADVRLVDWPTGGRVHGGFARALDDGGAYAAAVQALLRIGRRPAWFAGHSLGGALSVLASARLAASTAGVAARVVGVGAPRIGDRDFARSLPACREAWRVVNDRDLMTGFPPRPLGFVHCGRLHLLGPDGGIVARPADDEAELSEEGPGAARSDLPSPEEGVFSPMVDHAPSTYAVKLWNVTLPVEAVGADGG
ncbi:MAG TPA: lipase family protein [Planctomycetota bacterium]|nr:lipase family protein [Planctomycetota bacterium]